MDANGVDRALLVCARIDHNPDNNVYGAEAAATFPDRIAQVVDLDCAWTPMYGTPGAGNRLQEMADRWPLAGFTHYLRPDDDGDWLLGNEGEAVFALAAERGYVASIASLPHQQATLREVSRRFPEVPILNHHLGHPRVGNDAGLREVLASADVPGMYLKVSGYNYALDDFWAFPYPAIHPMLRQLHAAYGAERMCWGSDFPVSRRSTTYRQQLEMVRSQLDFLSQRDRNLILGETLAGLLARQAPTR